MKGEPVSIRNRFWHHGIRWAPVLALALLTYLLFPVSGFDLPLLDAGEVAPDDIVAPFDFDVPKTESELTRDAQILDATIKPIYDLTPGVADSLINEARQLFDYLDSLARLENVDSAALSGLQISETQARYLIDGDLVDSYENALVRLIRRRLKTGVASSGVLEAEPSAEIVIRGPDGERIESRDDVLSWSRYLAGRAEFFPEPDVAQGQGVFLQLLNAFFKPTLVPNVAETESSREALRATLDSVRYHVRANERIIAGHEVVTDAGRAKLLALRAELFDRGGATGGNFLSVVGQVSTNALLISIFWFLLTFYRRETYNEMRLMATVFAIFAIVIVGSAASVKLIGGGAELIPVPFAAMLITVLFSGRASLVAVTALAILLGSQAAYGGLDAVYLALVGGLAAAFSVRSIQRRSQLLIAFVLTTAGFVLAAATVALRFEWTWTQFGTSVGLGAANALASAALVTITLPLFEVGARVTTDLTLLELSDPNRPILRRLATEASGTYAHSIAMANLCEAACNAIGANGLLARVGCYYHDIGKMSRPRFFAENQVGGRNPHDSLSPAASAAIIRNHVTEGIELAEQHKVPRVIIDFIPEHHGTMEITYFLSRARDSNPDVEVDAERFQYPGPLPQSAETAVTMLADGVEAALRVIEDPTEEKMSDAINHIVNKRIEWGQLDQAPLTLGQINRVKKEFLRVVAGMYHSRIEYPEDSGGITAQWDAPNHEA